ncbi:MAG TPA: glycosyltransferase family 1 protein [Verrucomicrobiae bacterium]|jgi:glycosyltransferase involved in cell wall biosynthesis
MKIGLTTSVIQRGKTGIAEYLFSLVRAFESHAKKHQFILFVLEGDLPLFDFAKKFVQLISVPEKFRPPLKDIFWHQIILPKLTRKLQLDVLHVPSYRRLLWRKPCALVATVHDLAAFHVAEKYDPARMFYGRVVARQLALRQDAVIAISQNTARDIKKFWKLPDEKIAVVHHGVNHERFFPAMREIAKANGANHFGLQHLFFLYVARLEHPAKNHLRLIEAFERFKEETQSPWQLVLAGGDWHGAETIHAAIKNSPFARDIRCLGFVSPAELPILYRAADVFVYPSLYEGFGFPPLEAMACGCPVLCSARGALGEVVGDAAVTVNPEDVAELKFQLTRLAADENLRGQLRAAGLVRAKSFDWRRTAGATLEIYERAVQQRNSPILSNAPQRGGVPPPQLGSPPDCKISAAMVQ